MACPNCPLSPVEQDYARSDARDERAHAGEQQQFFDEADPCHDVLPRTGSGEYQKGAETLVPWRSWPTEEKQPASASAGLPTRNRPSSTAAPKPTRFSGGVSRNGRSPLGFELRIFQRTDATSLPSGSTRPCYPDRARVWPSACSRRRVSEIRQGGSLGVSYKLRSKGLEPIELLREMRLDGLSSAGKRFRGAQKYTRRGVRVASASYDPVLKECRSMRFSTLSGCHGLGT